MNKTLKRLRITSLSLGIIAACGLVYNLILFAYLRPRVVHFEALADQVETLGLLTGLSLFLVGLFHLSTVITLLLQIFVRKSAGLLKTLAVVIGVISGLLLFSDLSMLQDIGKQYEMRWDTAGEWTILFINHGLHGLFTLLAFSALISKDETDRSREAPVKDEVLFLTAHTTGLLCGGIGLTGIALALIGPLPVWVAKAISVPIGLLIVLPYLLVLGAWLAAKHREKIADWFDEKQLQDISRAGLWTLAITFLCMLAAGLLQRANGPGSLWDFLWLPLYLFLSMTTFSAVTLHYARR